jgi:hypothetical protein
MQLPEVVAVFVNANGSEVYVSGGQEPKPGDVVTVTKRNGAEVRKTVRRLLHTMRGAWRVEVA